MSYVKKALAPNERVVLSARISPTLLVLPFIFLLAGFALFLNGLIFLSKHSDTLGMQGWVLFSIGMLLILAAFVIMVQYIVLVQTTEFAVTNHRLIGRQGLFRRRPFELPIPDLQSVSAHQNPLGRILNFGRITITGSNVKPETFRILQNPTRLQNQINQIRMDYMKAFADHQAQQTALPGE